MSAAAYLLPRHSLPRVSQQNTVKVGAATLSVAYFSEEDGYHVTAINVGGHWFGSEAWRDDFVDSLESLLAAEFAAEAAEQATQDAICAEENRRAA